MPEPKLAILGPGAVGGLLAAALARAGSDPLLVAREGTAELIAARGIEVESAVLGEFTAHPRTAARLTEPVDALLVATKASGLAESLARIEDAAVAEAVVIPLLNGLEHMAPLRERFGARVAAGTIRVESHRPETGRIVQSSPWVLVEMASDGSVPRERLEAIASSLERAGLTALVGDSEAGVLWSKLARLCPLALTTSAADQPIGFVREDPQWRPRGEACIGEVCAVARAEGVEIEAAQVIAELGIAHATLGSSMQRDIAAGIAPELDEIGGAVVRAAARHGLACPTIEGLMEDIRGRIAS